MESSVFKRASYAGTQISAKVYNVTIGLTLFWGFLVNWLVITTVPAEAFFQYYQECMFGSLICMFIGSFVLNRSDKPAISFLGYNLIVIPFGFVLNMVVSMYDPSLVLEAIKVTAEITFVMMLLGTMYPRFFLSIGRGLFIALLVSLVVQLVNAFIFHQQVGAMDWIVVMIFSGYIGFDWARANAIPKTVDNAIDSAAALYLDIINIFLRVLSILSRR